MALLLDEMAAMAPLPLNTPLPQDPVLRGCAWMLRQPSLDTGLDAMAARAGMSRRTFTRQFRLQTGLALPSGASRRACWPPSRGWPPASPSRASR
jgi:transcriptional regulator GlxA family with amidase domain